MRRWTRSPATSAAVPATIAMSTDTPTRPTLYRMVPCMLIADIPT